MEERGATKYLSVVVHVDVAIAYIYSGTMLRIGVELDFSLVANA